MISDALSSKVYFIVDEHPSEAFTLQDPGLAEAVRMRRIFNSNFIKQHYRPGDCILIEEDASLPKDKLPTRLLPQVRFDDYAIEGFDNPLAFALAKPLIAIQEVFSRVFFWLFDSKKEDVAALKNFVEAHIHPELPLPSAEIHMLKEYFPLSLDIAQERYLDDTWEMRQTYMSEKLDDKLLPGKNLFVVTGQLHVKAWLPFPCNYEIVDHQSPKTLPAVREPTPSWR